MRQSCLFLCLLLMWGSTHSEDRGLHRKTLKATTQAGEQLSLYKESHALLIGVSEYTHWPRLDSIPSELDQVEEALQAQDFNVVRLTNPGGDELSNGIENFIDEYGYEHENRLLIYFSGHGHSVGEKGLLIPADAPLPEDKKFRRNSVPMSRVLSWARDMEAKHALFLFDSCFSGSVFKSRNLPGKSERYIRKATAEPVRQFITAGSANQVVPAKSTFTPALVRAINGEGDLNNDGYITGSELGVHLSQLVPQFTDQNPQYGKIKDFDLAQGDFVFFKQVILQAPEVPSDSDQSLEALLWSSTERGNSLAEYQAYIEQFPNGTFTRLAQARIDALRRSQAVKAEPIENESTEPHAEPETGALTVSVIPEDARVRIMNIAPAYNDGIRLERNRRYDISVTRQGYESDRRWIRLMQENQTIKITLKRLESTIGNGAESASSVHSAPYLNGYYRSGLKIEYLDDNLVDTGTVTFHIDDNRIVDQFSRSNGNNYSVIYEHNEKGLLLSRTVTGGSGQVRLYTYGENMRPVTEHRRYPSGKTRTTTFNWNSFGQIDQRMREDFHSNGNLARKTQYIFHYDNSGKLTKRTCKDLLNSDAGCADVNYKLDQQGRIVERFSEIERRTFAYDLNNNLVERVKYNKSGNPYERVTASYSKTDRSVANRYQFTYSLYP